MKRREIILAFLTFILLLIVNCVQKDEILILKGPYLGQKPPAMIPEMFAPGIISTEFHEHSSPAFPVMVGRYFLNRAVRKSRGIPIQGIMIFGS